MLLEAQFVTLRHHQHSVCSQLTLSDHNTTGERQVNTIPECSKLDRARQATKETCNLTLSTEYATLKYSLKPYSNIVRDTFIDSRLINIELENTHLLSNTYVHLYKNAHGIKQRLATKLSYNHYSFDKLHEIDD